MKMSKGTLVSVTAISLLSTMLVFEKLYSRELEKHIKILDGLLDTSLSNTDRLITLTKNDMNISTEETTEES